MRRAHCTRAFLALAVVGCGHPPATTTNALPIVDGVDTDGDPAVAFADGSACTATLIAPRVLLTAGHCADRRIEQGAIFAPVPLTDDVAQRIVEARPSADFDSATYANDIGLMLLAEPAGVEPVQVFSGTLGESDEGTDVRIVGFGKTSETDTEPPRKREGVALLDHLDDTRAFLRAGPSLPCAGDSGGPVLMEVDGAEVLVAVISGGPGECAGEAIATRVDHYRSELIEPFIAATTEGSAAAGEPCFYPAHCAEGTCVDATEGFDYCAPACSTHGDCPDGMRCVEAECSYVEVGPGAIGATCSSTAECYAGSCALSPHGDSPVCADTCFEGIPICDDGFECLADELSSRFACFEKRPSGGGCSITRTRNPWLSGTILAALAPVLLARRSFRRRRDT